METQKVSVEARVDAMLEGKTALPLDTTHALVPVVWGSHEDYPEK